FKKKLQQLSDKLNADEAEGFVKDSSPAVKKDMPGESRDSGPDNIEALKEIVIGAIAQAVKMLGYSNRVLSGLIIHSAFADSAVENVALYALVKDNDFIKQVKRTLKAKGVTYTDNLRIEMRSGSE